MFRPQTQRQGKKKKRGNRQKTGALKEISRDIKDLIRGVHSSSRRNDNSCFNSVIPSRRLNVRRQVYTYLNSGINAPFSSGSGTNRSLGYQRFQQPGPRFPSVSFTPSGPKRKWLIEFMLPIQRVWEPVLARPSSRSRTHLCSWATSPAHVQINASECGRARIKIIQSVICSVWDGERERDSFFSFVLDPSNISAWVFFFFFCLWQTGTGKELILEVTKAELNYRTSLQKKRKKKHNKMHAMLRRIFPKLRAELSRVLEAVGRIVSSGKHP